MADRPRSIKRQLSGQTRKPKRLDHQAHGIPTGSPLEAMAEEDETTTDEPEEEDVPSSADSDDEPPARPIPPMLRNRSISNPRMNLRPYVPPVDEFEEDGDEGEMSVDSEEEDLVAAMRAGHVSVVAPNPMEGTDSLFVDAESTDASRPPADPGDPADRNRRLSLRLEQRPSVQSLKDRNILPDEGAPAAREAVAHRLSFRLEDRPSMEQLRDRNIYKSDPSVEPSEQGAAVSEQFQERIRSLKSILKFREADWLDGMDVLVGGQLDAEFAQRIKGLREQHAAQRSLSPGDHSLTASPSVSTENLHRSSSLPQLEVGSGGASTPTKRLGFNETVEVIETFADSEFGSRRPDPDSTFLHLDNQAKKAIRQELNDYKRDEMPVHLLSVSNTVFH